MRNLKVTERGASLDGDVLRTVHQPLLVLSRELRVLSANPAFHRDFKIDPSETRSRLIFELGGGQWNIPRLRERLERVFTENRAMENFRLESAFGKADLRVLLLSADRIRSEDEEDCILLAFSDVTEWERAVSDLEGQKEYADKILDATRNALLILDKNLRVRRANETFYKTFKTEPAETEGRPIYDLGNGQWNIPALRDALENVLPVDLAFNGYEIAHEFDTIGRKVMRLNGRRIDRLQLVLLAIEDVTERERAQTALRESREIGRMALASGRVGAWRWDLDKRLCGGDAMLFALFGLPPAQGMVPVEPFLDLMSPESRNQAEAAMAAVLQPGQFFDGEITIVEGPKAGRQLSWRGRAGEDPSQITGVIFDATERRRAIRALSESEQRYKLLVEQAVDGIFLTTQDGRFIDVNPAGAGMLGMTREELLACNFFDVLAPEEYCRLAETMAGLTEGKVHRDEWRFRRKDGSIFTGWLAGRRMPDGRYQGVLRDISDRKLTEQHQQLLMAELDHRVKNTLAVVQSIARQSLSSSAGEAADRFIGRLAALGQAHTLLAESHWQGASLKRLIVEALAPHRPPGAEDRVSIRCPDYRTNPKTAQALALVFHELGTNATKYGALSPDGGRVSIACELRNGDKGQAVLLTWTETGGPPITAPPARKGFGARVIVQMVEYELEGRVELDYRRTGLVAALEIPFDRLLGHAAPVSQPHGPTPDEPAGTGTGIPAPLAGKRILVVEDQILIAEQIVAILQSAGCVVVGPAASLAQAGPLAEAEALEAAVLDINLGGTMVWPIARTLRNRGVPFVFATGYSARVQPPSEDLKAPRLDKPIDATKLLSTLSALV